MFHLPSLQSEIQPLHERIVARVAMPEEISRYRELRGQIGRLFFSAHGMTELEWVGTHVERQSRGFACESFAVAHKAAWRCVERRPPCGLCSYYLGGGCVHGLDARVGANCPEMPHEQDYEAL